MCDPLSPTIFQLAEGAENVGSWPALGQTVQQKTRKESDKEGKPLRGDGLEEGEGGKVVGREKKVSTVGIGGDKKGGSGGVGTGGGGGGGGGGSGGGVGAAVEKAGDGDANGDGQRFAQGRRKGTEFFYFT